MSAFRDTVPFYICEKAFEQCVASNPDDAKAQSTCEENRQCGSRNATAAEASTDEESNDEDDEDDNSSDESQDDSGSSAESTSDDQEENSQEENSQPESAAILLSQSTVTSTSAALFAIACMLAL